MANPYRDEAGKYTSADRMRAAIDRLQKEGTFSEYLELSALYDQIIAEKEDQVTVSKKVLQALSPYNHVVSELNDPEEITNIYSALKDSKSDHTNTIVDILNNPATPREVKQSIYTDASDELRRKLIKQFNNEKDPATSRDVKALIAGTQDKEVLDAAVTSKKLTFEDKYSVAQTYDQGLGVLANNFPDAFMRDRVAMDTLRNKTRELLQAGEIDKASDALAFFAHYGKNPEDQAFVLDAYSEQELSYGHFSLSYLASNPNLTPENGLRFLKLLQYKDLHSYKSYYRDIYDNKAVRSGLYSYNDNREAPLKTVDPKVVERLNELKAKQAAGEKIRESEKVSCQAAYDAQEDNYRSLTKEVKMMGKKNAPERNADGETYRDLAERLRSAHLFMQVESINLSFSIRR